MRLLKRIGDRLAAIVLLILLSPLLAAIALWIVIDGGRPAVLGQERAGKDGKTFRMLEEGRAAADDGRDVVVGLVETHARAETAALLDGLEVVHRRRVRYRGRIDDGPLDGARLRLVAKGGVVFVYDGRWTGM